MKFRFYSGEGKQPAAEKRRLPVRPRERLLEPADYIVEQGLRDAVNVALLLRQPLLLTGEPGTGKTQLAYSVAWELDLGAALKFETKSNSRARDLFYVYDALGRFQAQDRDNEPRNFLTYGALGAAILRTQDEAAVQQYLPPAFEHGGACQSVVLIDEVDKAPRDFPNDILNELELMYFRIPELGDAVIHAAPELSPILIITSNSEKGLPDAFLRRCVYYHIPFPKRETLAEIVTRRLGAFAGASSELLAGALDLFFLLRGGGLVKSPATAELLDWLLVIRKAAEDGADPLSDRELVLGTLSTLTKNKEDQKTATKIVQRWLDSRSGQTG